jgi:hypothetical protein
MGSQKNATPLDHFTIEDFKTLQHVVDHGQITIQFKTDSQACNTKFRLMRLIYSLEVFQPDDPLTQGCKCLMFKWRKNQDVLTIVDRARSQEADAIRDALAGKCEAVSSDPLELGIDSDALERAYVEQQASKGNS